MRFMERRSSQSPRLDAEHAAFIQGGVSVIVATRDASLAPEAVRACGCRVSRDRRRVTVLLDPVRVERLLADVAANGMVAVVFSQPSTHRTIQLKGSDAASGTVGRRDRVLLAAQRGAWIEDLRRIGYPRDFAEALWGPLPRALAAISFTPTAAFQQTPGPSAGQPIGC
jgi:hypothetical protein